MRRLEMKENTMLKWMCGVTLRERKRTAELMDCLGVVSGVEPPTVEVISLRTTKMHGTGMLNIKIRVMQGISG